MKPPPAPSYEPMYDLRLAVDPRVQPTSWRQFWRLLREGRLRWASLPWELDILEETLKARPSFPEADWRRTGLDMGLVRLFVKELSEVTLLPNDHLLPQDSYCFISNSSGIDLVENQLVGRLEYRLRRRLRWEALYNDELNAAGWPLGEVIRILFADAGQQDAQAKQPQGTSVAPKRKEEGSRGGAEALDGQS